MATSNENFMVHLWGTKILDRLDKGLVYGNLVRDYEDEIKEAGNRVKNNTIGTQKTLTIDQQKYFNFQVDDIGKFQSNNDLINKTTERIGYAMTNSIDQHIASSLYTDIPAENQIGNDTTPIDIDETNAYKNLIKLSVILDNNNVPRKGRWVVVPCWYEGLLLKNTSFTRDADKVMRKGYVGEFAGMSVYKSNNVPNTSNAKYKVIAGTDDGIYMAIKLLKLESLRMENRFADLVRGLYVCSVKNLRPETMALLICNK